MVMARFWEELWDDLVSATEMEGVGGLELGMCDKVSWEEVVDVWNFIRDGDVWRWKVGVGDAAGDEFGDEE